MLITYTKTHIINQIFIFTHTHTHTHTHNNKQLSILLFSYIIIFHTFSKFK